jgi:hypothetical protein
LWRTEPEESSLLKSIGDKLSSLNPIASFQSTVDRAARLKWFFVFFLAGMGCYAVAFMFLPVVLLVPAKFALMFSMGSVSMQCAMSYLKASLLEYVKSLCGAQTCLLTLLYFLSLAGCIWAAVVQRSYLLVVVWTVVQAGCIFWYILSFFPGGTTGLSKMLSYTCSTCCSMCCYGSRSLLPV